MRLPVGVEDVAGLGLGIDIVGAYVLSRGLLSSVQEISRAGTFLGVEMAYVDKIRDRVAAETGLALLGFGFLLQLVSSALQASGVGSAEASFGRVAVFAASTTIGAGLGWMTYRARRRKRELRLAARVLSTDLYGQTRVPEGEHVLKAADILGFHPRVGETFGEFARRTFGLDEVTQADQPARQSGEAT
ncbi:MAG TPA: hypothetical protein VF529_09060 [Solirubrobacteraceae bacterium]